jgi:hypothetical protein
VEWHFVNFRDTAVETITISMDEAKSTKTRTNIVCHHVGDTFGSLLL